MANKINFQKELDKLLEQNQCEGRIPSLFLHSCCAPCSSYVIEYLSDYFQITVFYYNPNIYPDEEYLHRVKEQQHLICQIPQKYPVSFLEGDFDKERFYDMAKLAKEHGFDYFCTTLSISPLKNAQKLNEIGEELADTYGIPWLPSDFKKKNGYKRSVELSALYGLYRQDYCGCVFSKKERERQIASELI